MSPFPEEPLNISKNEGYGYFPAYPGLKLHGDQYEVVHKLGYGPRSSVWFVKHTRDSQYLALKILTAHASEHATKELAVLKVIQSKTLDDLPLLQCQFTVTSAHGVHLCIGLTVMGASVEDLRLSSPSKTLPVHVVKKAIGSMILPLDALHRSSIVHGAAMPENMLFYVGDAAAALARTSSCVAEKVVVDGVEYNIVRSQPLPHGYEWNEKKEVLSHSSIELHNVGHATILDNTSSPSWSGVPDNLRPPEVIIETGYDTKVDIWMLGCAAFYLLTGEPLVPKEKTEDEGEQLAWMQAMAGDVIKREMALKSPSGVRECFFTEEGFFVEEMPGVSLSSGFDKVPSNMYMSPEDKKDAIAFVEYCLALDPADRPAISTLKNHPWLQPGYACSCGYC